MMGRTLARGAIGGIIAGAVFIGITMWFAATQAPPQAMEPYLNPFRLISTEIVGPMAMQTGEVSVGLGIAIHVVQSALFGMLFALVVPSLKSNGMIALAGTAYGLALFLVNFVILAQVVPQFRAFQNTNYPFEFFAHIVYGTLLSFFFYREVGAQRAAAAATSPAR
jgi:hypothetical protein